MYEIYDSYADDYDRLVRYEDYKENLKKFLLKEIDWKDKIVFEAGIGTGRITEMYIHLAKQVIGADRAEHMLEKAERNLHSFPQKIQFVKMENDKLVFERDDFDIFIEGWSFGHTYLDDPKKTRFWLNRLFERLKITMKSGGTVIFIETLGTCVDAPGDSIEVLNQFYSMIENDFGFLRKTLQTDYKFTDLDDTEIITGFFFGDEMAQKVRKLGSPIVKEYTGIWIKKIN